MLVTALAILAAAWVASVVIRVQCDGAAFGAHTMVLSEDGYLYIELVLRSERDPGHQFSVNFGDVSGAGCGYRDHQLPGFDVHIGHRDVFHMHYWVPVLAASLMTLVAAAPLRITSLM